jgi:hypothetical protein
MWGAASQLAGSIHTQQSRQPRMGTGGVMVDVSQGTHTHQRYAHPNTEGEARTRGVDLCPLAPSNQGTTRHVTRPSLARCPDKTTDTTAQCVEQSAGEKRETVEQSRPGTPVDTSRAVDALPMLLTNGWFTKYFASKNVPLPAKAA